MSLADAGGPLEPVQSAIVVSRPAQRRPEIGGRHILRPARRNRGEPDQVVVSAVGSARTSRAGEVMLFGRCGPCGATEDGSLVFGPRPGRRCRAVWCGFHRRPRPYR